VCILQQVKRVEIVVDSLDFHSLLDELSAIGVHDYTAMKGVFGRGSRGERGGDPFSGAFDNTYVLLACQPEQVDLIVDTVRRILVGRGGMCLVSDAVWVHH
jgi:nitrogen regulatory protein PII